MQSATQRQNANLGWALATVVEKIASEEDYDEALDKATMLQIATLWHLLSQDAKDDVLSSLSCNDAEWPLSQALSQYTTWAETA